MIREKLYSAAHAAMDFRAHIRAFVTDVTRENAFSHNMRQIAFEISDTMPNTPAEAFDLLIAPDAQELLLKLPNHYWLFGLIQEALGSCEETDKQLSRKAVCTAARRIRNGASEDAVFLKYKQNRESTTAAELVYLTAQGYLLAPAAPSASPCVENPLYFDDCWNDKPEKDTSMSQARLVELCRQLVRLADDPHPGLFTWNEACANTVKEIRQLL